MKKVSCCILVNNNDFNQLEAAVNEVDLRQQFHGPIVEAEMLSLQRPHCTKELCSGANFLSLWHSEKVVSSIHQYSV